MRHVVLAAVVAGLCAGGTPLVAGQAAAPSSRLDLDLYWEYEVVSDPQVSPDGNQIIYTRQFIDRVNDKRETALWVMNADGSKNRFWCAAATRAGRRMAIASSTRRRASRKAPSCSCATWTPKAPSRR